MKKSVKLIILCVILVCCIMLSACSKDKSIFKVKTTQDKEISIQLMDVWQDSEGYVLVTLQGKGEQGSMMINDAVGKPHPYITTQILSNGKWLNHSDYPLGMYKYVDGGLLTLRFPTKDMPEKLEVSGVVLTLADLKLEGIDRQALLNAEQEKINRQKEFAKEQEEARKKLLENAEYIPIQTKLDTDWIQQTELLEGESLYYGATGMQNANGASISFILSADGKQARAYRAEVVGAKRDNTYIQRKQYTSNLPKDVENNHIVFEDKQLLLDVIIDGDTAKGVFCFTEEQTGKTNWYSGYGVVKVDMVKMR